MLRIVLLGAPGSGKGTQGARLADEYRVPQVAAGDLLREAVTNATARGQEAKAAMDAGELVSDALIVEMIRARLQERDTENGFILDGFPRSQAQAEALDSMLAELKRPLQRVVHLQVDTEEIVARLTARGRDDDTEDTIRNRLAVFADSTEPLVAYYQERGLLVPVVAQGEVEAIYARIKAVLAEA